MQYNMSNTEFLWMFLLILYVIFYTACISYVLYKIGVFSKVIKLMSRLANNNEDKKDEK